MRLLICILLRELVDVVVAVQSRGGLWFLFFAFLLPGSLPALMFVEVWTVSAQVFCRPPPAAAALPPWKSICTEFLRPPSLTPSLWDDIMQHINHRMLHFVRLCQLWCNVVTVGEWVTDSYHRHYRGARVTWVLYSIPFIPLHVISYSP